MLPFSDACERNKQPILGVLERYLDRPARVLEIGSGTGQHAVHFAGRLASVTWQPSDRAECLPGLAARTRLEGSANLHPPIVLDVSHVTDWPAPGSFDALFTANTLHIVSWPQVQDFFRGVARLFAPVAGALLFVYGPFKYRGEFTTSSNAAFDGALRARDPASGIRDFEAVDALAVQAGFVLVEDCAMPANNQMLVWRRRT